ncbi:MAG: ATP-binding protein [Patescibacteria group bacterium]
MKFRKAQNKIIFTTTVLLLAAGLIVSALIGFVSYQQSLVNKQVYLKDLVHEYSRNLDILTDSYRQLTDKLAKNKKIISFLESKQAINQSEILDTLEAANLNNNYTAIYLLNRDGLALVSTDPSFTGNDYAFREYFKQASLGNSGFEAAIGVTSLLPGYYFSAPVFGSQNELLGVLVMKMKIEPIHEILQDEIISKNGHIMLTDKDGIILFSDRPERTYQSLGKIDQATMARIKEEKKFLNFEIEALPYDPAYEIIKSPLLEPKMVNFFDTADNEKETLTIFRLAHLPLFLVLESDSEGLMISAFQIAGMFSLLIILIVILTDIFLIVIIKKNLWPLNKLKDMANEISLGNLNIKNSINTDDEFEELGEIMAKMSEELKNYYSDLENSILERTKELGEKNAQLENTKKAILNILSDVEAEKNKSLNLANDLEKFKLAMDNASDYMIISDANERVVYANKGMEKITGYKIKEVLGKKIEELWRLPLAPELKQKMDEALCVHKKPFVGELKNHRKNGELYDSYVTISPVLNKNKEVEFLISVARDITQEKNIDRAKTEFVSLASHQLRTPLSSINWYAEMLLDGDAGKLNKEQKNFVEAIYKGNQRMVELVNALLNVSRIELGTFAVEPVPTDFKAVAQSVLEELKPMISNKKLKIEFTSDSKLGLIPADPKLIRIVFQNLLSNAAKYTPDKGLIKIKIYPEGQNLMISVQDNGYGIPKEQQAKIFDKLFRADNVKEKDTEGTGLGLYIVKSIIEGSQGNVRFESEEDKGTTFFVSLPLKGMIKKTGTKTID